MLGQTMRVFKNTMAAALRKSDIDLSFELFVTLMFLSLEEKPIQQGIANHLQKDKSIILRHINILIDKQYVVRIPDQLDKRMKKLILTSKGIETVSLLKTIEKRVEKQLVSGINEEALHTFIEVLNKMQINGGMEEDFSHCSKSSKK